MLRGDNRTEDKTENRIEKADDKVQKAFDDVQNLKDKIEKMKKQTEQLAAVDQNEKMDTAVSAAENLTSTMEIDSAAIAAAEAAVRKHAIREAEGGLDYEQQRELKREEKIREARRIEIETQERFEEKKKAAEEKQRQLEEAEKLAAEVKRNNRRAEFRSVEHHNQRDIELREAELRREEEGKRLREIENRLDREKELNEQKAKAIERREKEKLAKIREKERKEYEKREKEKAIRLTKEKERREREALKFAKEEERREREAERQARKKEIIEKRNEEARKRQAEAKEAAAKRAEREALIVQQRAIQRRKREEEKAELRRIKKERDARRNEEKQARKKKLKEERLERAELRRQRRIAKKSAEIGGGIVNVHGTTVQTEIQPVASFSVKDILGLSKRKEIKATTSEEEKQALLEENERIKQEARASAVQLAEARRIKRHESSIASSTRRFLSFCDEKKKGLLIAISVVLALAVGTAAVFNYCTAYEYSYNGKALGYVKNKDDVLHITKLVQTALTEEKNVDVVIDARDDIDFERVYTFNKDIVIDSPDQVLKRLTYVGDLNVKAFGIYIDGKKVGAVADKNSAAKVFEKIKSKYVSKAEGSVVKNAVIVEKVDVKRSNTSLQDLLSVDEMVDKLCADGIRTTTHTVARGDTLGSISKLYNVSEKKILEDNNIADPEKLEVGSTVIISKTAPIMTVRITEERTYVEKTPYETIKKKDKDMYEGYTEVDQKGQKGVAEIKDRTVTVNGEEVSRKILESDVKKEPVEKIVRIGTKERPPTVGSGTYIWPAYDGTYVVTSEFKWRWGRQHQGIDMGCSTGTDVLAADGGTVVHAGWMGGYGNLVIIDHQNGVQTYYGHNSSLCVKKGDKVFQGQHIAEAGNTGNSFGSHIHFGVMDHGEFKNPRNYLP